MTREFDVFCESIINESWKDWAAAGLITTAAMAPLYKKALNYNKNQEDAGIEQKVEDDQEVPRAIPYNSQKTNDNIQTIHYKLQKLKGDKDLLKGYIKTLSIKNLRQLTGLNDKVPVKFLAPILYGGIYKNFPRYDIIAAVLSRESIFGQILDKEGRGDHGHGHGVMQIDDRSHSKWLRLGLWQDPYENIAYGLGEIKGNLMIFNGDMFKSLAAYNTGATNVKKSMKAGKSAEATTAHHNYATDVIKRARAFKSSDPYIAKN